MPNDLADMYNIWSDPLCEPENADSLDRYGPLKTIDHRPFYNAVSSSSKTDDPAKIDSDDHLVTSLASAVRKLADLNIAFYDCAAKLPPVTDMYGNAIGNELYGGRSRTKTLFAIDELFSLTSKFVDVVQSISREACDDSTTLPIQNPQTPSIELLSPAIYDPQLAHCGQNFTVASPRRSFSHIDEGTMLMIMSCHCRLTDIYLSLLQMIQACADHSMALRREQDWAILLPQLQVGSYASPPILVDAKTSIPSVTASMYMVMITMLSSQICENLANEMRMEDNDSSQAGRNVHLQGEKVGKNAIRPISPFYSLFTTTIADRTDRLRRTMDTTKQLLQRYSFATG